MTDYSQCFRTELPLIRMSVLLPVRQFVPGVFLSHLPVDPSGLQDPNHRISEAVVPHPAAATRLDAQLDQLACKGVLGPAGPFLASKLSPGKSSVSPAVFNRPTPSHPSLMRSGRTGFPLAEGACEHAPWTKYGRQFIAASPLSELENHMRPHDASGSEHSPSLPIWGRCPSLSG